MKYVNDQDFKDVLRETAFLQLLQGTLGVQEVFGVCLEWQMITSRYAGIPLSTYVSQYGLTHSTMASIMMQVGYAILTTNRKGVLHNNITGDNICIAETEEGIVATLIDFSEATQY